MTTSNREDVSRFNNQRFFPNSITKMNPRHSALTNATILLMLCFLATMVSAMPLSLMSQEELAALPDAVLEQNGRHRVKPGETTYSLAKQVSKIIIERFLDPVDGKGKWRFLKRVRMDQDDFHSFNLDVYPGCCSANNLPAGAIVKMGNPIEISTEKTAWTFGGKCSLHEYEFLGVSCGNIECRWSIMWPEDECGLWPKGLKKLQSIIIQKCFGYEDAFSDRFEAPDTDEIEVAEAEFKKRAHQFFRAEIDEYRGPWDFSAKGELSWPFGMKWENETWYRRPVIVFKNLGCWNHGGNGCHDTINAFVVSIPDGKILNEHDYFKEDALECLYKFVGNRFEQKYGAKRRFGGVHSEYFSDSFCGCCISVSEEGMTWWIAPYIIYANILSVTIPWSELEPFAR